MMQIVETEEVCPKCFGSGVESVPGKGARNCACQVSIIKEQLFKNANLPKRHSTSSLTNFKAGSITQGRALQFARSLVADYPHIDRGLLFIGSVGIGKTHLSAAILRGLIESKGVPGLFYESGALLKKIQSSYNPVSQMSEASVLAPVYEAEVLVLDELGAIVPSAWVRDTLYQIINNRYNDERLTIFTTNFGDVGPITLEERIGVPLRSRLYEMCNTIVMDGKDYRKPAELKGANQ